MTCRSFLLWALCLLATGCASPRPERALPTPALPERWSATVAAGDTVDMAPGPWWQAFADPQLDGLIALALARNSDLAAAAIRVRRAQALAGLTDTNRTPAVAVAASAGVTRSSSPAFTAKSYGLSAAVGYEPDPWGKLAAQREAAALEAGATSADCHATASALTVTAATLYWRLAFFNQLVTLSEADLAYARQTLALAGAKFGAGAVSGLNVVQAELSLATLEAAHTQLLQQRVEARHALALLFDQPPEAALDERRNLPEAALPAIAAGLPAAVLANRPDLQSAELRLRGTLANVDVTRTSFYPSLSLTGSLGTASSALGTLLANPVATLGAGLSLPFVQWNTMQLSVKVAETQYEEAVVNFRQRLYAALSEVENGLSARSQFLAEAEQLELAGSRARRAEDIAHARYLAGATELQPWLDAQLSLRGTERGRAANRLNQLSNQAALYRALGLTGQPVRGECTL